MQGEGLDRGGHEQRQDIHKAMGERRVLVPEEGDDRMQHVRAYKDKAVVQRFQGGRLHERAQDTSVDEHP